MSHFSARTAVRASYHLVRTPLTLFDDLVVERVFGADSAPHRVLAQGLERLDSLVDGEAGVGTMQSPPWAAGDRNVRDEPTARPGDEAAPVEEPEPAAGRDETAGDTLPADEQQEIEQLAEVFESDEELVPRAGELAENDDLRRVQAEIKAKQQVEDGHGQF
ncbi:hypothetical protein [uncultured Jatrophihabitans sp.]|uniref:hypothetical protein n=1 Tax=uncultured Jatrophihabitans sp. TaxID=1610747 RepID=UPI0035CC1794